MPPSPGAASLWRVAWHTSPARPASIGGPPRKSSTEGLRFESAASAVRRSAVTSTATRASCSGIASSGAGAATRCVWPRPRSSERCQLLGFAATRERYTMLLISVGRTRLRGTEESPRHPARPRRGSRGLREQALTQPRSPGASTSRRLCQRTAAGSNFSGLTSAKSSRWSRRRRAATMVPCVGGVTPQR